MQAKTENVWRNFAQKLLASSAAFAFAKKIMDIFVSNIPHSATADELRELFEPFGAVEKIKMLKDKFSGKPRGMAFVELQEGADVKNVVDSLNATEMLGRVLKVEIARSRTEKRPFNGFRAKKSFGKERAENQSRL